MNNRYILVGIAIVIATGCATKQAQQYYNMPVSGIAHTETESLKHKFTLCSICPKPTPKTLALPEQPVTQVVKPTQFAVIINPPQAPQTGLAAAHQEASAPQVANTNYTILFAYKSAKLQEAAKNTVTEIAAILKTDKSKGVMAVQINGYTDDIGGLSYNRVLAERRTSSVAKRLKQLGVNVPIVQTAGGECCFVVDNSSETNRALNRRVEIVFLNVNKGV